MTEAMADLVAVALDYPFARPNHSYLFVDGATLPLAEPGKDNIDGTLLRRGAAPMHERIAVLAYGANAAPSRLRQKFFCPYTGDDISCFQSAAS